MNLSGYINHINFSIGGNKVILEHFDIIRNIVSFVDKRYLQCLVNIGSSDEYGNLNSLKKSILGKCLILHIHLAKRLHLIS